jgi:serine/threonine protein kinase
MALLRVFLRAKKSGPVSPCTVLGSGKEKNAPPPSPPPPLDEVEVEPESLDDFVLDREVGRGSFGQAYAAHNRLNNREVCLKVTKTNEVETEALARLCDHPNIVQLYSKKEETPDNAAAAFFATKRTCAPTKPSAHKRKKDLLNEQRARSNPVRNDDGRRSGPTGRTS